MLNNDSVLRVFVSSCVSMCSTVSQSWTFSVSEAFEGLCSLSRAHVMTTRVVLGVASASAQC